MRQHCTDGSFRFCRWRAHTEALSEDSGPEALSTQGHYFALQVFDEILKHIASELSANCCRTITMARYRKMRLYSESREDTASAMYLSSTMIALSSAGWTDVVLSCVSTPRYPSGESPSRRKHA